MLESQTLKYLTGLKKNNNKTWFDAHRPQYESAKNDFQNFIDLVIKDLHRTDLAINGITAKDCLFRMNRDIRFSKDKTPYKTNMGSSIKRGGKKSLFAGYYFHCEPGNSFIGGGLWRPDAAQVKKVRQEIDYNWEEFQSILRNENFKNTYGDLYKGIDQSLSTNPKGYSKDNPAKDYLKLKSFMAETSILDEELTKASLHKKTVMAFQAITPLLHFINRTLDD